MNRPFNPLAGVPSAPAIGAPATNSPGTSNANKRAETGAAEVHPLSSVAPTFHASFVRVVGEGFDADQVTLPCAECGLSEYTCECEIESDDWPKLTDFPGGVNLTMEEVERRFARFFGKDVSRIEL